MKIVKPLTLGLLYKPYTYRRQHYFAITTLSFFRLGLQPQILTEHSQWSAVMQSLPAGQVLDLGMRKPCAEVLVAGHAHAPNGQAVTQMQVGLQLGAGLSDGPWVIDKTLQVIGDRRWRSGVLPVRRIEPAQPFVQMPLEYRLAYGGQGYADNPQGRGYLHQRGSLWRGPRSGPMPNILYPDQTIVPGRSRHTPAGLGALDLGCAARQALAGHYDQHWVEQAFPGYADDMGWAIFNAAAPDQRLPGLFSGAEHYRLQGLHPQQPCLQGRLPPIHARAFIARADQPQLVEVPLQADTLWLLPDHQLGIYLFHGDLPIADSDARDVTQLLVAYEAAGKPRPLAHYQRVMHQRLDPQTAAHHLFNEAPLIAQPDTLEPESVDHSEQQQAQAVLDEVMADFWQQSGLTPTGDAPQVDPGPLPPLSEQQQQQGNFSLEDWVGAAQTAAQAAQQQAQQDLQNLQQRLQQQGWQDRPAWVLTAQQALAQADPQQRLQQALDSLDLHDPQQYQSMRSQLQQGQQAQQQAAAVAVEPMYPQVDDAAAKALGQWVVQRLRLGLSLSAWHLGGVHLQGVDLSSVDLSGTCFERATLIDCRFNQAVLRQTSFVGAQIQRCDFSGEQVIQSNFCAAQVNAVRLQRCQVEQALLHSTVLHDCDFYASQLAHLMLIEAQAPGCGFERCNLQHCAFNDSDLSGSRWQYSRSHLCSWLHCTLVQAQVQHSHWRESAWLSCQAMQLNAQSVHWHKVLITYQCDLQRSNWALAKLDECGLRGTQLQHSDFSGATVHNCDLGQAQLDDSRWCNSHLLSCLLIEAQMARADCRNSYWYQSSARKASLRQADMRGAQLPAMELESIDWQDADLRDCQPQPTQRNSLTQAYRSLDVSPTQPQP